MQDAGGSSPLSGGPSIQRDVTVQMGPTEAHRTPTLGIQIRQLPREAAEATVAYVIEHPSLQCDTAIGRGHQPQRAGLLREVDQR